MAAIGIVIVTFNSAAEIGPCLDAAARCEADVVVVDNASEDSTCDEVRRRGVRLIANRTNRGFAAATNQGIKELDAPYVLLLNPDAVIQTPLEPLRACCERPFTAGAGGKLVDARGVAQVGFMVRRFPSPTALAFEALLLNRLWPRNPVNWQYRCLSLDYAVEQQVEQPAGAFLMIPREVWERLGGLEESFYPLWFEDVDFAKRARDLGFHMYYVPQAVAKHTGGHSIPKIPLEIRPFYWYGSFLRYAARHFGPWTTRALCGAVIIGSVIRMVTGIARVRSREPLVAYTKVLRLAGRYLFSGV